MSDRPQLVVALDVPDPATARQMAETLRGQVDLLKVGLQLFVAAGPGFVAEMIDRGWRIFLDLKFHDIPATTAGAVKAAVELGVELLTLHASGGTRMMEAAVAARGRAATPRLLAVTLLTSLQASDLRRLGQEPTPAAVVAGMAKAAHQSGCDGVVASAHEAVRIKQQRGPEFLVATPGIRPAGFAVDDQARVATVAAAIGAGADYLILGRPILRADDPAQAARAIRAEMETVDARR
ncbi:MAG: orotidine-5'-phosphate decarboxylase [Acidobacteriota bacterium]